MISSFDGEHRCRRQSWKQFANLGGLPQHGFARKSEWQLTESDESLNDYRNNALNLLCLSVLSGLPQVSIPLASVRRVVCILEIICSIAAPLVSSRRRDGRLAYVLELAYSCEKVERQSARQRDLLQ